MKFSSFIKSLNLVAFLHQQKERCCMSIERECKNLNSKACTEINKNLTAFMYFAVLVTIILDPTGDIKQSVILLVMFVVACISLVLIVLIGAAIFVDKDKLSVLANVVISLITKASSILKSVSKKS